MALLISMNWTGCMSPRVVVIQSDQVVERLPSGTAYTPRVDGWFLSDALYRRYRMAVSDKILEQQKPK